MSVAALAKRFHHPVLLDEHGGRRKSHHYLPRRCAGCTPRRQGDSVLERQMNNAEILVRRLPRLPTDQGDGIIKHPTDDPLTELIGIIEAMDNHTNSVQRA
jgi:hypothetical protein